VGAKQADDFASLEDRVGRGQPAARSKQATRAFLLLWTSRGRRWMAHRSAAQPARAQIHSCGRSLKSASAAEWRWAGRRGKSWVRRPNTRFPAQFLHGPVETQLSRSMGYGLGRSVVQCRLTAKLRHGSDSAPLRRLTAFPYQRMELGLSKKKNGIGPYGPIIISRARLITPDPGPCILSLPNKNIRDGCSYFSKFISEFNDVVFSLAVNVSVDSKASVMTSLISRCAGTVFRMCSYG
jgi:hypothetical protein